MTIVSGALTISWRRPLHHSNVLETLWQPTFQNIPRTNSRDFLRHRLHQIEKNSQKSSKYQQAWKLITPGRVYKPASPTSAFRHPIWKNKNIYVQIIQLLTFQLRKKYQKLKFDVRHLVNKSSKQITSFYPQTFLTNLNPAYSKNTPQGSVGCLEDFDRPHQHPIIMSWVLLLWAK